MESIYSAFEVNDELIDEGIWLDVVTASGRRIGEIKCRPADPDFNPAYRTAAAKLGEKRKHADLDDIADIDLESTIRIYADTVFCGWRGECWKDREGNAIEFTPDNCYRVMRDLIPLFRGVAAAARDWSNWRRDFVDEIAKNS